MSEALVKIGTAKAALIEAKEIHEILEIRDRAAAMSVYAAAKGAGEAANLAKEVQLRAERKAGEFLAGMEKQKPGQYQQRLQDTTVAPSLADIGITKDESHRWQKMARIPAEKFESHIVDILEEDKELTRAGIMRAAGDWYQRSDSVEWETPQWLFDLLNDEFSFELDVCASEVNAKCSRYYTKDDDGLAKSWDGVCWMNPPYGREIKDWMDKARREAESGSTVVCLVPARPDTEWWWDNCIGGEVRFIKGRIAFENAQGPAPFPSAVIVLGRKKGVIWWDIQTSREG